MTPPYLFDAIRVGKAPSLPDIGLPDLVTRVTASRRSRGPAVTASTVVGILVGNGPLDVALQFYGFYRETGKGHINELLDRRE